MVSKINSAVIPFQPPFMLTLCGPSQCGKTFWLYKLLQFIEVMIVPQINKIIYLYTTQQPIYGEMEKIIKEKKINIEFIDCNKGIPTANDLQTNLSDNTLVVLDDLMTVATASKENLENLNNFACRDAHHRNMSVIFVGQNLMYENGKLRNSRINSQYHLMFKNISDVRNMHTISDNRKIRRSVFDNVLNDINKNPHGYLLFDNCTNSYDNTRLRTNVFHGENTIIYDV